MIYSLKTLLKQSLWSINKVSSIALNNKSNFLPILTRTFAIGNLEINTIEKLRNIGISAHIDSGKTTITERILFYTGRIKAIHEVKGKDGVGAKMDSMELEREKGITIQSAATYCKWGDYNINIIDTPGHVDFTVEVERSMRVLDGCILLMCGVSGVQSQSMTVYRQMNRYKIPRLCFINKLDRQNANAYRVCKEIQEKLNPSSALVQIPIGSEENHSGIIDLITMESVYFTGPSGIKVERKEIPSNMLEEAKKYRTKMIEKLADVDQRIEELFLEEQDPSVEELKKAIKSSVISNKFIPIFVGSAYKNIGVQTLLDGVISYLPDPSLKNESALNIENKNEPVPLKPDANLPLVALAFKLDEGKYGQLTYLRVYQGKKDGKLGLLKRGENLLNTRENKIIKVNRIVRMHSSEMEDIQGVGPGEIVAMFGVECNSGDTFTGNKLKYSMMSMFVPDPVLTFAIKCKNTKDIENFSKALKRFQREDPTFRVGYNSEKNETLIKGMGELHLEIYAERIRREYNCDIVSPPRVNYRDTIQKKAKFNYLFKKQSGGQGQYAKVIGYIEPMDPNEEVYFEFKNNLVGLNIPPEYVPAIEKGFYEAMEEGRLTGNRVQGISFYTTLYFLIDDIDGQYHPVDSSELSFKTATKYAIAEAFKIADPTVLEPIMKVEIDTPEEFQGNVMGGISRRKGVIKDVMGNGLQYIRLSAIVPLSAMFGYSMELRQITQGRGEFSMEFSHLDKAPQSAVLKLVEDYKNTFKK